MNDSANLNPPTRQQNLRTLYFANFEGSFAAAFGAMVGGNFIIGLAKAYHAGDLWIGILTAIPGFCGLLQVPGSILGRRTPSFKAYITPGGITWRLLYMAMIFVPLLSIATEYKLMIMAAIIAVAGASVNMVAATYSDWLAEMVPANERGYFYGRRNATLNAVGALAGLFGALLLDRFKSAGNELVGFSVIFAIGVTCGIISQVLYSKMQDIPRKEVSAKGFQDSLKEFAATFEDRNFRKLLFFLFLLFAGQSFPGGFFSTYSLEVLKFQYWQLQMLGMLQAIGIVVASRFWGTFVDRYGNRPMLLLGAAGIAFTPTMWLFTNPLRPTFNFTLLCVFHFVIGLVWSGVILCQGNIILNTAPDEKRALYIGVGQTLQSIVSGIAPMFGAVVMTILRAQWPADQVQLAYKSLFAITMGLRAFSVIWLIPVREPGSRRIRDAVRAFAQPSPAGYMAIKQFQTAGDAQARTLALRKAGEMQFALAMQDAVDALHDPSPKVRRQAAVTLSQIGDVNAVEALVHQLREHPDLVEEETVEALGLLGDELAVDALIETLQSPSSQVRRAAARALGKIGSHAAVAALTMAVGPTNDLELRRAALQALGQISAEEAEVTFIESLMDPHPSIRVAASEAVSEIPLRNAREAILKALSTYQDESSSETAYALGVIGQQEDLGHILRQAQLCNSVITRRRCLLGAASLLGVESQLYKLLALSGMPRDKRIAEIAEELTKKKGSLRDIISLASEGDDAAAITALAKLHKSNAALQELARYPSQEAFLLALLVV